MFDPINQIVQAGEQAVDLLQWFLDGGAIAVLLLGALWSRDGTLRWGRAVDAQAAQYETHVTEMIRQITVDHEELLRIISEQHTDLVATITRVRDERDRCWELLHAALTEDTFEAWRVAHATGKLPRQTKE